MLHGLFPGRGGLAVTAGSARIKREKGDGGFQVRPAGETPRAGIVRTCAGEAPERFEHVLDGLREMVRKGHADRERIHRVLEHEENLAGDL